MRRIQDEGGRVHTNAPPREATARWSTSGEGPRAPAYLQHGRQHQDTTPRIRLSMKGPGQARRRSALTNEAIEVRFGARRNAALQHAVQSKQRGAAPVAATATQSRTNQLAWRLRDRSWASWRRESGRTRGRRRCAARAGPAALRPERTAPPAADTQTSAQTTTRRQSARLSVSRNDFA